MTLELDPGSHLAPLDPALATDVITLLGNLIDNAVEVSVGSVEARVTVTIEDRDGLAISVRDSGPGVPEDLRRPSSPVASHRSRMCPAGGYRPGTGASGHRTARRHRRDPRHARWRCTVPGATDPRRTAMRDVLVVDDDFMVAEIHRRFVDQVDGFRAVGWPARVPKRSPRRGNSSRR